MVRCNDIQKKRCYIHPAARYNSVVCWACECINRLVRTGIGCVNASIKLLGY